MARNRGRSSRPSSPTRRRRGFTRRDARGSSLARLTRFATGTTQTSSRASPTRTRSSPRTPTGYGRRSGRCVTSSTRRTSARERSGRAGRWRSFRWRATTRASPPSDTSPNPARPGIPSPNPSPNPSPKVSSRSRRRTWIRYPRPANPSCSSPRRIRQCPTPSAPRRPRNSRRTPRIGPSSSDRRMPPWTRRPGTSSAAPWASARRGIPSPPRRPTPPPPPPRTPRQTREPPREPPLRWAPYPPSSCDPTGTWGPTRTSGRRGSCSTPARTRMPCSARSPTWRRRSRRGSRVTTSALAATMTTRRRRMLRPRRG
mmetsp:Transcript_10478/g.40911  ORF Transcript_10478/g.40911 Transcript_10478/m.40911 type:complete len:314 (-) Transcript_10478:1791-2732(-)